MKYGTRLTIRTITTVLAVSLCLPVLAASKEKLDSRVRELTGYFELVQNDAATAVPADVLQKAEGLVIVHGFRGGLVLGYAGAEGVVIVKNKTTGQWGPVAFLRAAEGTFGFQGGGEQVDVVFVLMNADAVKTFTEPTVSPGVGARATAGDKSTGDQDYFKCEKPSVLVYGQWQGFYGGACLQSGWLLPDSGANKKYYGKEITMREILMGGQVESTEAAKGLASKIEQFAKPR